MPAKLRPLVVRELTLRSCDSPKDDALTTGAILSLFLTGRGRAGCSNDRVIDPFEIISGLDGISNDDESLLTA